MASASPRLWVTARLQVSAPGQATTSRASSAPGSAIPIEAKPGVQGSQLVEGARPRNTMFWRLVTRTSTSKSRWMAASDRNWSDVMSPRRQKA